MKKIALVAIAILCLFLIAAEMPPALPSSFYGTADRAGDTINVSVGGVVIATAPVIWLPDGSAVYSVNIPMDGIAEGTVAVFWTKQTFCVGGTAALYSGSSTTLNLFFPVCTRPRR
jgi:hypothetical protein